MTSEIFLYHGFRKSSDVQVVDGHIPVSCRGKGAGGQSDGFYVWNNLEKAKEYLGGNICDNPVICTIKASSDDFRYPQWQIDYEALGNLNEVDCEKQEKIRKKLAKLFVKYKDEIAVSYDYKEDLKKRGENGFELLGVNETKYGAVRLLIHPNKSNCRAALYEGNLMFSGCEQVLNDYMCSHSEGYLKEYNDLLKESLSCYGVAFKYVGNKNLEVVDVYDGNGNKEQKLTEQFLPKKCHQPISVSLISNKKYSR